MSTLNLDNEFPESEFRGSNVRTFLRSAGITVLVFAILGSAAANGYYYFKNQELNERLDEIQKDVKSIKSEVGGAYGIDSKQDDLEREIKDVADKLADIDRDLREIKSSVDSIESDVSSIQLKVDD